MATSGARRRATKIGVVTSNRMTKSVVVRVDKIVLHRMYKRFVRRSATFMAHDETERCELGDTVEIVESRPLSARKRWRVRRVIRTAVGYEETPQDAPRRRAAAGDAKS